VSKVSGIDRQLGLPFAAATLLACGLALAYFVWLGPDSVVVPKLVLFTLMALCGVVAFLAIGTISIVHSLHERIERLEQRGEGVGPDRTAFDEAADVKPSGSKWTDE
jgi:hypothetical protein